MTTMVWTYAAYLAVCGGITIWVAQTLRKNGTVFVTDGRNYGTELSNAISRLLTVGFYLVNFGFICLLLKHGAQVTDPQSAIELLSTKIGGVLLALGCMHFVILTIFSGIRKNNRSTTEPIFENRYGEPLSNPTAVRHERPN
ncbi:hypothetical protein Pan258_28090 [Symmachiella dynata]|uniref:hypothetical protein n=1 Tax=Symmachiella dynata TaxID=2527995 RepID=UPI00118C6B8A|nr:hypothetical protein [Symmachiella dynata]QDT48764.1 hypothetical protein Pan258_28090 [Symmachiella dynata]